VDLYSALDDKHLTQEGPGRSHSPPRPLLAVPNATAYTPTASVPNTVLLYNGPLLCSFNVPVKALKIPGAGLIGRGRCHGDIQFVVVAVCKGDPNSLRSAKVASGLQPIAVRPHACVIAKNSALLPLRSTHGWHERMITQGVPDWDLQDYG